MESAEHPTLVLCIFPHLKEFLTINLRAGATGERPIRLLHTDEVFTKRFFQDVEQSFSEELQDTEMPFANLMNLPQHVELMVRHHSIAAILEHLGLEAHTTDLAVFLVAGPVLTMGDVQLTQALRRIMGPEVSPTLIMDGVQEVERLLLQERELARQAEAEQAEEAILEDSSSFLSLWEARN